MKHMRHNNMIGLALTAALFLVAFGAAGESSLVVRRDEPIPPLELDEDMAVLAAVDETEAVPPEAAQAVAVPQTLDLATAQAIALRDNPSLKGAAHRVEQARQKIKQARSTYFPVVGVSTSATHTRLDQTSYDNQSQIYYLLQSQSPTTSVVDSLLDELAPLPQLPIPNEYLQVLVDVFSQDEEFDRSYTDYSLSLTARWQLFDGFAREFTHAATKHAHRESESAFLDAKRMLLSAVATSYYTAALARENNRVAEADEAFNLRLLKEASARYEAGAAAYSDQLNFEVRANRGRALLIAANRDYSLAKMTLAELMGLPEGRLPADVELAPLPKELPEELDTPAEESLLAYALGHRPDLLRREHAVERANASRKARRGAYFPSVNLTAAQASTQRTKFNMDPDNFGTAIQLDVSYTLFAGGLNRSRVAEARAAHAETEEDLYRIEINVQTEVRQALRQLIAAQDQLRLQRDNAVLVQEARDMVEKGYMVGQTSLVRLNEAQRDLLTTQAELALSRVNLRQAWNNLRTATAQSLR